MPRLSLPRTRFCTNMDAAYALIAARGKMLSFAEPVNDYSRRIAFVRPQTEQRQFSSPWLHVYIAMHASPQPASHVFLF